MQAYTRSYNQGTLSASEFDNVLRLRYQAFRERLNWDVQTFEGHEQDYYDELHPAYVIVRNEQRVVACCRLPPTTGAYMLRYTFPQLLAGQAAPDAYDIWEISRFAVTKEARHGFGFTALPTALIRATARYALANGIREYVFVTTPALERLLTRMGVHLQRLGPTLQIGVERSVALRVYMDHQTIFATGAHLPASYGADTWECFVHQGDVARNG